MIWFSRGQACLPLPSLGIQALVDFSNGFALPTLAQGSTGKAGDGTWITVLPLPSNGAFAGSTLYAQAFSVDSVSPLSLLYTQGLRFTFRMSISPLFSALYDRMAYQKLVVDAKSGLALWNANAIKGFSYVGTEKYSCGGQTHWIVNVVDDKYKIPFVLIPGGSFIMGDMPMTIYPVHWVHVEPFLLAKTEITQSQWQSVMGSQPWQGTKLFGPYPTCAANWITWNLATLSPTYSFCGRTGWRLPSESEWEYACRAGTTTDFSFGNDWKKDLKDYAWFRDNANDYPHKVATKLPNSFGLHDMHGNVCEWVQDTHFQYYYGAPTNGSAWEKPSTWNYRVIRGGAQQFDAYACRSGNRSSSPPNGTNRLDPGFRPALSLR